MVGRFVEKKGMADGLLACANAVAAGVDLTVTVIGDARGSAESDQEIKNELQSIAQQPELSARVRFTGLLSKHETIEVLSTHDLFLCPSKHAKCGDAEGGLPVVLLEAMALGLVCVGSRHCDIPEAILGEITGFLFDEGDVSGLSRILCDLQSKPERMNAIASAGRRHIEKTFNLHGQLAMLQRNYNYVAQRAR
jgi:colanic acid/amylovoran biosynthesis glycosyltransferase